MSRAVDCLKQDLEYMQEEIKAAEKKLAESRDAMTRIQGHLAGYYINRDDLIDALAMVKKRVAP